MTQIKRIRDDNLEQKKAFPLFLRCKPKIKQTACWCRGLLFFLSPVQTDATLLANNSQHCWMLHVAYVCTPCCMMLDVVAQSLKPVKLFSQLLPRFLLFLDRRSVVQQCWIRLHSSSNIVGATHAHYAWFTKTYGLCPSHDALVGSCCNRLQTTANTHATTPNIVGATMLGVVASVSSQP